eukprot:jgi/Mesvir1/21299/Mv21690-RA.1
MVAIKLIKHLLKIAVLCLSGLLIAINIVYMIKNGVNINGSKCQVLHDLMPINNIILAFTVIIAEMERPFVIRWARFTYPWLGRGLYLIFVAFLAESVCYVGTKESMRLAHSVGGMGIGVCGVVYIVLA